MSRASVEGVEIAEVRTPLVVLFSLISRATHQIEVGALNKAKRILKAKTESDAVRQAISLVAFRATQSYDP